MIEALLFVIAGTLLCKFHPLEVRGERVLGEVCIVIGIFWTSGLLVLRAIETIVRIWR